jgi:ketosteroid isomerase-like protein
MLMQFAKNRQILATVIVVAAAVVLIAAAALQVYAQAATQDEALQMQKQFQDACVAADVSAIEPLMADDAIFIHGNGAMQGKTEFLDSIKKGQLALSAYELKDAKVILINGGAIVTGLEDLTFKPPAGSTSPGRTIHMRGSGVWQHKGGKWQLVLDQDTTLAGPPPARSEALRP